MMDDVAQSADYAFTIEPFTREDKKIVLATTIASIKRVCSISFILIFTLATVLLFFGFSKEDLMIDLFAVLFLLSVLFLIVSIMFLHVKWTLRDEYKIVEKGIVTKQETDHESNVIYSYLGSQTDAVFAGNVKVGDRILIAHSINKKLQKKLFIKVEKI